MPHCLTGPLRPPSVPFCATRSPVQAPAAVREGVVPIRVAHVPR